MENFGGYTNFVDDIDDVNFDNFLTKRGRQKLKKGLGKASGVSAIKQMKRDIKKANELGMTLRDYRKMKKEEEMAKREGRQQSVSTRPSKRPLFRDKIKARLQSNIQKRNAKQLAQAENDAILDGVSPKDAEVDVVETDVIDTDVPTTLEDAPNTAPQSFFEKNKKMIMIAGGVALAGFVYVKFIKK